MSKAILFVEGGGNTAELKNRCREGFTTLLRRAGFEGMMPRIVPCGTRRAAYDDFVMAHRQGNYNFVALWVDSEDPVGDVEQPWAHLLARQSDKWERPVGASDEQVFLMTTCMETWLLADRPALRAHYKTKLKESALPSLTDLEARHRHDVQDALERATQDCTNAYQKNKRAFALLAAVNPAELEKHLPAFARMVRILREKL